MSLAFATPLLLSRMQHATNIFNWIMENPDLPKGKIGQVLGPIYCAYSRVHEEYLAQFYEQLYPITMLLQKYCDLCESCSKSGAYTGRRDDAFQQLLEHIVGYEREPELLKLLESMLKPTEV